MTEKNNDGIVFEVRTFLITCSPKDDIHDHCVQKIAQWLKKNCILYYAVVEHGNTGKRHLHVICVTRDAKETRRVQNDMWVKVKKFHPTSIGSVAVKVQVAPGNDWYHEYLQKEIATREVVCDQWDPAEAEQYFPTKATQDALIVASKKKVADSFMVEHEAQWIQMYAGDDSFESACRYLKHRMNVSRDMRVIQDLRRFRQLAMALSAFRRREVEPTPGDIAFKNRECTAFDFTGPQ